MARFRALIPADHARVLALNAANEPAVGHLDADRLDFLARESELALVAEIAHPAGPIVVGFCLVLGPGSTYDSVNYRWFMERFDDAWYLDRVAFDAGFRGQGLGTELYGCVDAQIEQRRATGAQIHRLTLEVNVDPPNEPSLAFHARLGFVEIGRQQTDYGPVVAMFEKRYES